MLMRFLAGMLVACNLMAMDATGLWKTVDDKTGKPRGIIRIYEKGGELFGKIESSFNPKEAKEVCNLCPDERKNQPVIGLVVLRHMKKIGEEWIGGDIVDPDTGSVYRCRMKLVDAGRKLILRGYIGVSLFGRSQIWLRAAGN
jgi:uncharacterized protein (DUF2147 family)